jgi:membrane protein required for colicin V production
MNWVDYTFIGIVVYSMLLGVWRGLVREAVSLSALIAAFLVAGLYGPDVGLWLESAIDSPLARSATAHILVFVGVLMIGALVTWLASHVVDAAGLSGTNRMLGGGFGVLRGLLLITAFVLVAGLTLLRDEPALQASKLRPSFEPAAAMLERAIPAEWLAWLKDGPGSSLKSLPET